MSAAHAVAGAVAGHGRAPATRSASVARTMRTRVPLTVARRVSEAEVVRGDGAGHRDRACVAAAACRLTVRGHARHNDDGSVGDAKDAARDAAERAAEPAQ